VSNLSIMIPKSHPRYHSLMKREKLIEYFERGIVATAGLIAHGRGETFDYLLGERTTKFALEAERAAVAKMITAKNPVISVNGNVTALAAKEVVKLSRLTNAKIEVNLFYRTEERIKKIVKEFEKYGVKILGDKPDALIPRLEHKRALCTTEGIYSSDVVLVPLEDGDRAQALKKMGKFVITIDLNPLSRTARAADITIVDELTRALRNMIEFSRVITKENSEKILSNYRNREILSRALTHIKERLEKLATDSQALRV